MSSLVYVYGTLIIIVITFLIYLYNDGFAQSICFLIPYLDKKPEKKMECFNYLLPSWDANQTWLVFCLAALYGAFPGIFSTLIPRLYSEMFCLLFLFIIRGACIEFIFKEKVFYKQIELINLTNENFDVCTPAFDVTPSELISGIITEKGIAKYPYSVSLLEHKNA